MSRTRAWRWDHTAAIVLFCALVLVVRHNVIDFPWWLGLLFSGGFGFSLGWWAR